MPLSSSASSADPPELSAGLVHLRNEAADEVLFVLDGTGAAAIAGREQRLSRDTAFYLAPGRPLTLRSDDSAPLVLASARCPAMAHAKASPAAAKATTNESPASLASNPPWRRNSRRSRL